jgi:hypothetical protein
MQQFSLGTHLDDRFQAEKGAFIQAPVRMKWSFISTSGFLVFVTHRFQDPTKQQRTTRGGEVYDHRPFKPQLG